MISCSSPAIQSKQEAPSGRCCVATWTAATPQRITSNASVTTHTRGLPPGVASPALGSSLGCLLWRSPHDEEGQLPVALGPSALPSEHALLEEHHPQPPEAAKVHWRQEVSSENFAILSFLGRDDTKGVHPTGVPDVTRFPPRISPAVAEKPIGASVCVGAE